MFLCFNNLPLHIGDTNTGSAHPLSSHFPVSMSQVSLFLQWLHVLEQLTSYVPVSQPKNNQEYCWKKIQIPNNLTMKRLKMIKVQVLQTYQKSAPHIFPKLERRSLFYAAGKTIYISSLFYILPGRQLVLCVTYHQWSTHLLIQVIHLIRLIHGYCNPADVLCSVLHCLLIW